jgi:hypothetical protein
VYTTVHRDKIDNSLVDLLANATADHRMSMNSTTLKKKKKTKYRLNHQDSPKQREQSPTRSPLKTILPSPQNRRDSFTVERCGNVNHDSIPSQLECCEIKETQGHCASSHLNGLVMIVSL